jgi:sortase A
VNAAYSLSAGNAGGAPGWYLDPIATTRRRWFDGDDWTTLISDSATTSRSAPTSSIRQAFRLGTTLITVLAVLAVGYFSWTLYFSNLWGQYQQSALRHQLSAIAAATPPPPAGAAQPPAVPAIPATGTPVGVISIPKIGVNYVFTSGTADAQLANGPGLWQAGAFPGTPGNATISGHRTTHGAYLRHLDQLAPGDLIYIQVPGQPQAVFQVRATQAVLPTDVAVTDSTPGVRLTLTTCNPPYSASQRLVVQAEEIQGAWASHALPPTQWSFS